MKKWLSKLIAVVLVCAMVLPLTACNGIGSSAQIQSDDLMQDIEKNTETNVDDTTCGNGVANNPEDAVANFSVRLFQKSMEEGKNTLISPLSVIVALSMTANGAKGETIKQMENVFDTQVTTLNPYLRDYMENLPQGDKYKLQLANSIWFTNHERFTVNQDFLQTNADYYGADIYKTAFDNTTLKDINLWVEQKTDGMIKNILDKIPPEAIMYLINALVFEAEWAKTYEKGQVRDGVFTTEAGVEQKVEMMYSDESFYLEDEQATGLIKYYKGKKYAFVALLPKEGVSIADYVKDMSGDELRTLISNPQNIHVDAAIPVFETEYDVLMNDVLMQMGMTDAFDMKKADFTGLGTSTAGNIFISRVIHKTYITVGPQGTKAGAATVVEMKDESAPFYEESKTVHLDRPFVYMLIDCENNQPFFMGTMLNMEEECGLNG